MWHTSRGDRTLSGHEAALVRTAIGSMIDRLLVHVDEEIDNHEITSDARIDCDCAIAVYDSLTLSQRIALLHDVATFLLTKTNRVLPLSAATEATVAAIFVEVRDQVAIEIDFPLETAAEPPARSWRSLVLAAYHSVFADDIDEGLADELMPAELPGPFSTDIFQWEFLIESLSDAILWDRDFEMADSFLDEDPHRSHHRRRLLGIDDEYFTRIADDPRPDQVYGLVSRTRRIVKARPR